jgi:hypothetical protein
VTEAADQLSNTELETLRLAIPALRALPPLQKLAARGEAGRVIMDYLSPMQLAVDIGPC